METILVYALYVWVIVSVAALIVQLIRRVFYNRSRNKQRAAETGAIESERRSPVVDLTKSNGADRAASAVIVPATDARTSEPSQPNEKTSVLAGPTVSPAVGGEAPTPTGPPAMPSSSRPGPADSTNGHTTAAATPPAPSKTLADALTGVRLPWDLLPEIDRGQPASDQRLSLLTSSAAPGEVGGAVADELERLGFVVVAHTDDRARATRGDDVLGLRIIPEAAGDTIDGVVRFPGAGESTVALDIWLES